MAQLKKGVYASLLGIGQSFIDKSVGLISTLVLARVLAPEDFGLVASATIFMGFVDLISRTGGNDYITKAECIDEDIINTAWTINFILKCFISLIVIVSASPVAQHFGDERLIHILYFFSFSTFFSAFGNPGLETLRREHNILPIIKNNLVGKVLAVCSAVTIALIYETYWALIMGQFISQSSRLFGSYLLSSHRPRFCLKNAEKQFGFSFWIMAQSFLGYGRTQFDSFLVASNFTQAQLGQYNIMKYIAYLPNPLILGPATGPLFRQLATIKNTKEHFYNSVTVSTLIALCIALPMSGIMFASGPQLVEIVLGSQWIEYANIFSLFAFLIPPYVLYHQSLRLLKIFDNTKGIFQFECISFLIIFSCLYLVGFDNLLLFTTVKIALENFFSLVFLFLVMLRYVGLRSFMSLLYLSLPLVVFNLALSYFLSSNSFSANPFLQTIMLVIVYLVVLVLLMSIYFFCLHKKNKEITSINMYLFKAYNKVKKSI